MARKGPIIAVDGPSGVGKSTISRILAERLNLRYVNTGAMYRALALAADAAGVDLKNNSELDSFCVRVKIEYNEKNGHITLDGRDFSGEVRSQRAGELASISSANPAVRECLVRFQRSLGADGAIVMEGRDIGTVVFPDADLKIYLDASHEVRARRRHLELVEKGEEAPEEVSKEIRERDRRDSQRKVSPLKMADDAVFIDTSDLSIDDVVDKVMKIAEERLKS